MLVMFPAWASSEETLYDFEGRPHALEEYLGKGKWLIVTVWASDCAVCNKEIPEMVAFHNAHRDKDATVLGISVDGPGRKPKRRPSSRATRSVSRICWTTGARSRRSTCASPAAHGSAARP